MGNCKAAGVKCDFCGKLGHLSKLCFTKKAQSKSQNKTPLDASVSDSVDNCSLFIRNKEMLYPSVLLGKKVRVRIKEKEAKYKYTKFQKSSLPRIVLKMRLKMRNIESCFEIQVLK